MTVMFENDDNAATWWANEARVTEEVFAATEAFMSTQIGLSVKFDEVAYMVGSMAYEYVLIESAIRNGGWQATNAAFDQVATSPILSNYRVHYTFLTHPKRTWRMEVMRIVEGISPLHATAGGAPLVRVHHSFKTPNAGFYSEVVRMMSEGDWVPAQRCESTYGRFSYWRKPEILPIDDAMHDAPYIKPRVNLRDAEVQA